MGKAGKSFKRTATRLSIKLKRWPHRLIVTDFIFAIFVCGAGAIKYDLLWQMSLASVRKVGARAGRRGADGGCVRVLYAGSPASLQSSGLRSVARHCNCSNTGWRLDRGWARHLLSTLTPDCLNTIAVIRCSVCLCECEAVVRCSASYLHQKPVKIISA